MQARQLGPVTYLTAGEARSTTASVGSQVDRAWNLWKAQAGVPERP